MNDFKPAKFCPGCGYPIILLSLQKIVAEMKLTKKTIIGLDIGCSLLAWDYLPVNTFQTHHGRVTSAMVGYKRAKKDSVCVAVTGDGGAYAIGLQGLLHAALRDEPVMVIVVNNVVYGMTGGQSAPTSYAGQITDTHPAGYEEKSLFGPELIRNVADENAFIARTSADNAADIFSFMRQAITAQMDGHFSLIEILSFCPTNWKTQGQETIDYLQNLKKIYKTGIISRA